jgi:hypothetical protein
MKLKLISVLTFLENYIEDLLKNLIITQNQFEISVLIYKLDFD